MKRVQTLLPLIMLGGISLTLSGCMPYHEAVWVRLETNEIPFLMDERAPPSSETQTSLNDNQRMDNLRKQLLDARRVTIDHEWKQTGRLWFSGRWEPSQKLVIVDTSPTTRRWSAERDKGTSTEDQGVWVESQDSVDFSTGFVITAKISSKEDAVKFLHQYPPRSTKQIKHRNGSFTAQVTKLDDIMDAEILADVQSLFADLAGKYPMSECRSKKGEIIDQIREQVIPTYAEHGITIKTLGMFGGFTYKNPENQKAIDKVFAAEQEEFVAEAKTRAAEKQKEAERILGEAQAAKEVEIARGVAEAEALVAEAKAKAIQAMADARAYELEKFTTNPEAYLQLKQLEIVQKRAERWDGSYPQQLFGDLPGEKVNLFIQPALVDSGR